MSSSAPAAVPLNPPRWRSGVLDPVLLLAVLLLAWQAVASWTSGVAVAPPLPTMAYLVGLVGTAGFWGHAGATGAAFLASFGISAAIGLALGLLLGLRRFAADVIEPVLAGFYTIPKVTLYPVVLLVFGLGAPAKVAFGVMHGLVPITLFTLGAVRSLPPVLLRTTRVLRLTPWQAAWSVLVPACLPAVVDGLRVGFALSLLGVLIGEMFASQQGLGFLLVSGLAQHNIRLATAVVVVIVTGAVFANLLIRHLGRLVTRSGMGA